MIKLTQIYVPYVLPDSVVVSDLFQVNPDPDTD
jgi:hypothetical protein